jgi:hypothetical protein
LRAFLGIGVKYRASVSQTAPLVPPLVSNGSVPWPALPGS